MAGPVSARGRRRRGPCSTEPDLSYVWASVAAALPLTGRPPRFELVEDLDAEEDLSLVVSGCGERHVDHGWLRGRTEDLAPALTMVDDAR